MWRIGRRERVTGSVRRRNRAKPATATRLLPRIRAAGPFQPRIFVARARWQRRSSRSSRSAPPPTPHAAHRTLQRSSSRSEPRETRRVAIHHPLPHLPPSGPRNEHASGVARRSSRGCGALRTERARTIFVVGAALRVSRRNGGYSMGYISSSERSSRRCDAARARRCQRTGPPRVTVARTLNRFRAIIEIDQENAHQTLAISTCAAALPLDSTSPSRPPSARGSRSSPPA